jgi:hypothetical protein
MPGIPVTGSDGTPLCATATAESVHAEARGLASLQLTIVASAAAATPSAPLLELRPVRLLRSARDSLTATSSRLLSLSSVDQSRLPVEPLSASPPGPGVNHRVRFRSSGTDAQLLRRGSLGRRTGAPSTAFRTRPIKSHSESRLLLRRRKPEAVAAARRRFVAHPACDLEHLPLAHRAATLRRPRWGSSSGGYDPLVVSTHIASRGVLGSRLNPRLGDGAPRLARRVRPACRP